MKLIPKVRCLVPDIFSSHYASDTEECHEYENNTDNDIGNGPKLHLTAFPRVWKYPFYTMEGEFYVEYLGCSSLTKPATGLGAIQTPLREKYFIYKKSGKGKKTQEVGLRVNAGGIEIIFRGSHPGDPNNQVYDLGSIYICEAVRFVTTKGSDKKLQAGFIPIDNSRTPNTGNEKLFSPLDKKQHSLAKVSHPPIVACVMRRSIGVKVVECHSFVAQTDDIALRIVSLVDSLKYRHADHPEPNRYEQDNMRNPQRPDLIRTEFGEFGIYRGGSRQNNPPDDNFRGGNRPSDSWESDGRRYSDEQEPNRYLVDNRGQERYGGQYDDPRRISGEETRIIHERQRSDELRPRNGHSEREEENRRSGEGFNESSAMRLGFNYGRPGRPSTREEGQQFRIPRPMSPLRSPGKEPPVPAPKPNRPLSPSPTHGPPDRARYPREETPYQRDPPYSSRDQREPPYSPRDVPYSRDQQFTPRDPPYSPRDQPYSPRDKPFTPREPVNQGPAYSQSNRESRGEEETQKKPVAKVPPHLVAGVKVLPTGFAAALKKPPSPREDSGRLIQKEKFYEEEDPYDNAISKREYYENQGRRNVKSEGDRYIKEVPYGMPPPDVLPREERDNYNEMDRLGVNQYRREGERQPSPRSNRYSAPPDDKPWTFDEQLKKYSNEKTREHMKSESAYDFRSHHNADRNSGISDNRDMTSALNQMNIQRGHVNTSAHNFEESLGYFP